MSGDDRDHIRQMRRAEREKKEKEFQAEMEQWEAERKARQEVRRRQREAEQAAENSTTTPASTAVSEHNTTRPSEASKPSIAIDPSTYSSTATPARRTLKRTETQKVIEENLTEWEADRKDRIAERELEALERKKALETQAAAEEEERKARAEARRAQREKERQQEEAEEQARKDRLAARKAEREAQRLAEERESADRENARRKAREERDQQRAAKEEKERREESDRKAARQAKKEEEKERERLKEEERKAAKLAKKEEKKQAKSGALNKSSSEVSPEESQEKIDFEQQLKREYASWGTITQPTPSPSEVPAINSSYSSSPNTPSFDSSGSAHVGTVPAPGTLAIPRPESPIRFESPKRKKLGDIKRSTTPTGSSSTQTFPVPIPGAQSNLSSSQEGITESPTSNASPLGTPDRKSSQSPASVDSHETDEDFIKERTVEEKLQKQAARDAKEEERHRLLMMAAEAETQKQAALDDAIREQMRKEEEELRNKEKKALEAQLLTAPTPAIAAPTATTTLSSSSAEKSPSVSPSPNAAKPKINRRGAATIGSPVPGSVGGFHMRFPTKDRPIGMVPAPTSHRLTTMELFCIGGGGAEKAKRMPDPELLMNHLIREGRLAKDCVTEILLQVRTAFLFEKNVLSVPAPATIIGDLHGQFFDLAHLFRQLGGLPGSGQTQSGANESFVFLGDYVDRGTFSCEVCLILFALKLRYPTKIFLLRGNHETRAMTSYHNFQKEATHKYGEAIYEMFMEVFDHLPLAAIVEAKKLGRVFCCHGGLSPAFKTIEELQELDRVAEPPDEGALCDLIWADPVDDDKYFNQNFSRNKERGCSVVFGYNPIYDFLENNNLVFMVRAHQVEEKGYRELKFSQAPPGRNNQPLVITLFSAPNYCDSYENMAAYLVIEDEEYHFHQYTWQDHPFCLPDFANAFGFSLSFVGESIMKFLLNIVESVHEVEIEGADKEEEAEDAEAAKTLDLKLKAVAKTFIELKKMREASMLKLGNIVDQMQKQQQQQNQVPSLVSGATKETLDQIRSKGGRKRVQRVVSDLSDMVKQAHNRFQLAKQADKDNERFHGKAKWKSTFRKLGRGITFKM